MPRATKGIGRAGASTRINLWGALNRSQRSARGWAAREQELLGRDEGAYNEKEEDVARVRLPEPHRPPIYAWLLERRLLPSLYT